MDKRASLQVDLQKEECTLWSETFVLSSLPLTDSKLPKASVFEPIVERPILVLQVGYSHVADTFRAFPAINFRTTAGSAHESDCTSDTKKLKPTPNTLAIIRLLERDFNVDQVLENLPAVSAGYVRTVRSRFRNGRYAL
jgi:hypothetical protein